MRRCRPWAWVLASLACKADKGEDTADGDTGEDYVPCTPDPAAVSPGCAATVFQADGEHDSIGSSLAMVGDVDGDGREDVLIGGASYDDPYPGIGAAYLFRGPLSHVEPASSADALLVGEEYYDHAGHSVAGPGDLDGDGLDDLLVGAPTINDPGSAYVVHGPVSGELGLGSADAVLSGWDQYGEGYRDYFGYSVAGPGDVDGDGARDLLVGAPYANGDNGDAWLIHGPVSGEHSVEDVGRRLEGEDSCHYSKEGGRYCGHAGLAVAAAGDLDGDGLADLVVGALDVHVAANYGGAVYVLLASGSLASGGDVLLADADARLYGQIANQGLGASVAAAGDTNLDGYPDLAIGTWTTYMDVCPAYLALGPFSGDLVPGEAGATLAMSEEDDGRTAVHSAGDLDGDGRGDLLVGVSATPSDPEAPGAYLFLGPLTGTVAREQAAITVTPDDSLDGLAGSVTGGRDVDGDGVPDVMTSGSRHAQALAGHGESYLFSGADLLDWME